MAPWQSVVLNACYSSTKSQNKLLKVCKNCTNTNIDCELQREASVVFSFGKFSNDVILPIRYNKHHNLITIRFDPTGAFTLRIDTRVSARTCAHPHGHACPLQSNSLETRMWANAQRDGRPAEYRWRPLFNAAKFRLRPLLECRAVTLPRREAR